MRVRGRSGFTLMEMLTVMWALSIAAVLGATLLLAALRADRVAATTLRTLACRLCGRSFEAPVKRGRPPTVCPSCR